MRIALITGAITALSSTAYGTEVCITDITKYTQTRPYSLSIPQHFDYPSDVYNLQDWSCAERDALSTTLGAHGLYIGGLAFSCSLTGVASGVGTVLGGYGLVMGTIGFVISQTSCDDLKTDEERQIVCEQLKEYGLECKDE